MNNIYRSVTFSVLAIISITLSSCATQQGSYSGPDITKSGKYSDTVDNSFEETWTAVIDFVSTSSFAIDNFERDSGLITLSFGASDPSTYIDCGTYTSTGTVNFDGKYVDYITRNQGSRLSGQMNISIRSISDTQTNVRVNARYIWNASTNYPANFRNTYSFDSGSSSTVFIDNATSGTIPTRTCAPTYAAESAVLDFVNNL